MFWFHNFWLQFLDSPLLLNLNLQQSLEGLSWPGETPKGMARVGLTVHHWPPSKSNICIRWLHVYSISFRNNLGKWHLLVASKLSSLVKCLSALTIFKPKRKKVIEREVRAKLIIKYVYIKILEKHWDFPQIRTFVPLVGKLSRRINKGFQPTCQ